MSFQSIIISFIVIFSWNLGKAQSTFNKRILINEGIFQPASLFIGEDDNIYVYSLRLNSGSHELCSSVYSVEGVLLDTLCILGNIGQYGVYPENDGFSQNTDHIQAGPLALSDSLSGAFYQIYFGYGEPYRFNSFTNPWWNGEYVIPSNQGMLPRDWILTQEGGVILSYSGNANFDEFVDTGIIYFDENDNYQWHLDWVNPVNERIFALAELNGSIYLAIERWNDELVVNNEILIYKLDQQGNIILSWVEPWSLNVGNCKEMLADGNELIIVGSTQVENELPNAFVSKLDTSMNMLWSTTVPNDQNYYNRQFEDITITTDGNYVVSGQHPIILEQEDPIHGDYLDDGWLAKYNSNTGELLWERFYRIIESTGKIHEIFDVKATSDGGVAFCGESIDLTDDFTPTNPAQQGWLVKTDEFGCLVPGCQYVGVEEEDTTTLEFFKFGPNPLTKNHSLNFYLLQDLSPNAQLELWSLEGKKLAAINPGYKGLTTIWELPQLSAGVYSLVLNDGGNVLQSEMVVIE